jgi:hypothetical protein
MKQKKQHPHANLLFVAENDTVVLYVEVEGKRIARRGSRENWTMLEPGYTVRGSEPGGNPGYLEIEFNPHAAQPQ